MHIYIYIYTHTKDISKCTHVCHLLMIVFIVEGKLAGNAALFYESAYISSVLLRKAWWCCCDFFLNLVLHIWCCTVFICLFSFFFFFKVCWSFENVSILNNGALIGLREKKMKASVFRFWKKKEKRETTRPHNLISLHTATSSVCVSFCFVLQCSMNMLLRIMLKKYI